MYKLFSFAFPHFLVFLVFSFQVHLQNTEKQEESRKTCEKRLAGGEEELRATRSAMGESSGCEWKIMRLARVDVKMRGIER